MSSFLYIRESTGLCHLYPVLGKILVRRCVLQTQNLSRNIMWKCFRNAIVVFHTHFLVRRISGNSSAVNSGGKMHTNFTRSLYYYHTPVYAKSIMMHYPWCIKAASLLILIVMWRTPGFSSLLMR